jgi:HSP20 family protein
MFMAKVVTRISLVRKMHVIVSHATTERSAMAEKNTDIATRQSEGMTRQRYEGGHPFRMLERFVDEIDSMFDDIGSGRGWSALRPSRNLLRQRPTGTPIEYWAPQIEISQQNNELVVRADLPGMKREDISVDIRENELTISGERRQEQENNSNGYYQSERSYGSFYRVIPLPDGAMADQANATFRNGVLEIRMPAPPEQVTRGRKLEIKEGAETPATAKK